MIHQARLLCKTFRAEKRVPLWLLEPELCSRRLQLHGEMLIVLIPWFPSLIGELTKFEISLKIEARENILPQVDMVFRG